MPHIPNPDPDHCSSGGETELSSYLGRLPHSSYLAGELLDDVWCVGDLRCLLVQGHHHEELEEPLLLQLDEIPLQGLVVRVPLGGRAPQAPLATWGEQKTPKQPELALPHTYRAQERTQQCHQGGKGWVDLPNIQKLPVGYETCVSSSCTELIFPQAGRK